MTDFLWCCHARGPDDLYAAPDYETALAWSDMLNAINWRDDQTPFSWNDCLIKAAPAKWPYSAESHAEDLPKSIAGFALPVSIKTAKLLPCPFCGASPHRGQAKPFCDQMHGELLHHYRIWCPHGCASLRRVNEEMTVSAWNHRPVLTSAYREEK